MLASVPPGARSARRSIAQRSGRLRSSAARFCTARPPSMICSTASVELRRHRRRRGGDQEASQFRQPSGIGVAALLQQPIEIELPRRKLGAELRRRAEPRFGRSGEAQRRRLGAEAGLDLIEPRAGGIGLDLAGQPPRH